MSWATAADCWSIIGLRCDADGTPGIGAAVIDHKSLLILQYILLVLPSPALSCLHILYGFV